MNIKDKMFKDHLRIGIQFLPIYFTKIGISSQPLKTIIETILSPLLSNKKYFLIPKSKKDRQFIQKSNNIDQLLSYLCISKTNL